jgi:hypothetical protein
VSTTESDARVTTLRVSQERLIDAAARHGVERHVAEAIWTTLSVGQTVVGDRGSGLRREEARFAGATRLSRTVRVLLYVGAVLVVGSFGWWSAEVDWEPGGLLVLSVAYGAGFLGAAIYARRRGLDELAAAAATIVAFYVPVVVYAALRLAGFGFVFEKDGVAAFYDWVDGGWIWMELVSIAVAVALYAAFRAPLLVLPLGLFLLFFAMDGTARVAGVDFDETSEQAIGAAVLAFGLLSGAVGVALDYRGLRRHALWPHVFCAVGIVDGLAFLLGGESWELAAILAGAAFLAAGVWLGRVGYLIAGGLSLWIGVTALAPSPIVLTLSGLAAVGVAVWLSLARSPLRRWLGSRTLPAPQRD